MREEVSKVIVISQSSEIYLTIEDYLEQINKTNKKKYVLNWLNDFEEWERESNIVKHDIYLIDKNILPSLTQENIKKIQEENNIAPIVCITNSAANGQFLLNLGFSDYLNIKTLIPTDLERSLRLLLSNVAKQKYREISEKAKSNEPSFRDFFQQANIAMALIAPSGQFLQANSTLCQLLGYSEPEFSELTFQDITHPEDLENSGKYLEQVLTADASIKSIAKRYLSKNQQWKWVKFSAFLARDVKQNPLYLIATIQNLDNNQVAQNEIKSSETLYKGFFSHSTDGLFSLSVLPNNVLIYDTINTAYEQIIGISKAEITGKHLQELLPTVEARKYRNCINSKQSLSYEHTLNIKGVAHTWLTILVPIEDDQGNIIKIHGSTRDITQEKQAIAQQIRQTRYRNLLRSIALKIRQSLDIEVILQTTVTELQKNYSCGSSNSVSAFR